VLEVGGLDDIALEHIGVLTGMYSALKNGEETVESMFDPRRAGAPFSVVKNPLKDDDESVDDSAVKDLSDKPQTDSAPKDESRTESERPAGPAAQTPGGAAADSTSREPSAAAFADPIKAAEERGRADRARGMSQKAVPPEWRTNDKTALAPAWLRGWQGGAHE
jgi:hypothetical protein